MMLCRPIVQTMAGDDSTQFDSSGSDTDSCDSTTIEEDGSGHHGTIDEDIVNFDRYSNQRFYNNDALFAGNNHPNGTLDSLTLGPGLSTVDNLDPIEVQQHQYHHHPYCHPLDPNNPPPLQGTLRTTGLNHGQTQPKKQRKSRKNSANKKKNKKQPTCEARAATEASKLHKQHQARRQKFFPTTLNSPSSLKNMPVTRRSLEAGSPSSATAATEPREESGGTPKSSPKADKTATKPASKKTDKKPTYNAKVIGIPAKLGECQEKLKRWIEIADGQRKKLAPLEKKIQQLEEQLVELMKRAGKNAMNAEMQKKINEHYKNNLFRSAKFILCDEDELKVSTPIYNEEYDASKQEELGELHKNIWLKTYRDYITSVCNNYRSYIQTRIKHAFRQFHETNKFIPSVEELITCSKRTIDMSKEKNVTIFDFYARVLLGK